MTGALPQGPGIACGGEGTGVLKSPATKVDIGRESESGSHTIEEIKNVTIELMKYVRGAG